MFGIEMNGSYTANTARYLSCIQCCDLSFDHRSYTHICFEGRKTIFNGISNEFRSAATCMAMRYFSSNHMTLAILSGIPCHPSHCVVAVVVVIVWIGDLFGEKYHDGKEREKKPYPNKKRHKIVYFGNRLQIFIMFNATKGQNDDGGV